MQSDSTFFMNFTKQFSDECKEAMRPLLQCRMRLSTIGECAQRLLAHSPTTLSKLKLRISHEIIIQNEKKIDSFYLAYMGWIKTKNHLTLLSL
jgi:hypothetical protein